MQWTSIFIFLFFVFFFVFFSSSPRSSERKMDIQHAFVDTLSFPSFCVGVSLNHLSVEQTEIWWTVINISMKSRTMLFKRLVLHSHFVSLFSCSCCSFFLPHVVKIGRKSAVYRGFTGAVTGSLKVNFPETAVYRRNRSGFSNMGLSSSHRFPGILSIHTDLPYVFWLFSSRSGTKRRNDFAPFWCFFRLCTPSV